MIDRLEEQVDPFDLDVFSPYIQANLIKQAQRCSVSCFFLFSKLKSSIEIFLYKVTLLKKI